MSTSTTFDQDKFKFITEFVIYNRDTHLTVIDKVVAAGRAFDYAIKLCTKESYESTTIPVPNRS